ncbi:MAG TPA: hypothetical protein VNO14_15780, partial [Blastocatellia bacterium]|nr:hypothetical protein [Blastocatellia bacterium]
PQTGLRLMSGKELAAMKRDADFYRDLKFKGLYTSLTLAGKASVRGREAYVIEAGLPEGGSDRIYFDTETGLIVRSDTEREGPLGLTNTESYFEDHRIIDGITIPFTLRQHSGLVNVVIKLREVRHNVPIDDSIFYPPG